METLERMPFQAQNAVFKKLAAITDVSTLSSKERERYDESLKIYRDNYAADQYSYDKGHREGRAEGEKKGIEKGRREGEKKGRAEGEKKGLEKGRRKGLEEGRIMIAKNLKAIGIDIQAIIQSTGLTKEQIDQL